MILYHFPTSPFARRIRLALASKGLSAELRDARGNPEHAAALRRVNPFHTVPVLIDGDRVVLDSNAISQYIDRKHPDPPLWPEGLIGADAFEITALIDSSITVLVDAGMRYYPLNDSAKFEAVREHMVGRAQRGLDMLASKVGGRTGPLFGTWSFVDMALVTMVIWIETMPTRAATFPPAGQMLSLGWTLPTALSTWTNQHRTRSDVRGLG